MNIIQKGLAVEVIFLFIGLAVAPSINAYDNKSSNLTEHSSVKTTVYFCNASIEFDKQEWKSAHRHSSQETRASYLHFDADLDELIIEVVMNYTAEMNYTLKIPYPLAPMLAFGFKVENFTDYIWETFKLKHNGYYKKKGNITAIVNIDMNEVQSGDMEVLKIQVATLGEQHFRHPYFNSPDNRSYWLIIMLILYNMPLLGKVFLHNWLLPLLAPCNCFNKGPKIWIYFD